ncbi:MAG: hypothetical protein JWO50_431 [Candidatus Kaiserbacteria bacterium]|nr:hypothetical protein [Candidatus Kaiserbacteria bacterium]
MSEFNKDWFIIYSKKRNVVPLKTIEEARAAHQDAPRGSEQELLALSKWAGLSFQAAKKAKNAKEAEEACKAAPDKTQAYCLARDKWDEFSIVDARKAKTPMQLRRVIIQARHGSKAIDIALSRWEELALLMAQKASDIEKCVAAIEASPSTTWYSSKASSLAISKRNAFLQIELDKAMTYEEVSRVFIMCSDMNLKGTDIYKHAGMRVNQFYNKLHRRKQIDVESEDVHCSNGSVYY